MKQRAIVKEKNGKAIWKPRETAVSKDSWREKSAEEVSDAKSLGDRTRSARASYRRGWGSLRIHKGVVGTTAPGMEKEKVTC